MSEIILPRWNNRRDVTRDDNHTDFTDLAHLMANHYHFYELIYGAVAPYEARQRQTDEHTDELLPYVAPSVELLTSLIRRMSVISERAYKQVIRGIAQWCAYNDRMFALPVPHCTTVHSIQMPYGAFKIEAAGAMSRISFDGFKSTILVQKISNPDKIKHLVIRPKSSASGAPKLDQWEVLTFDEDHGYIPLWVDSTANPRFAGTV